MNKQTINGQEQRTANSTFAIGGVSFSADSFVVTGSSVLRMNIVLKSPPIANPQNVMRHAWGHRNFKLTARN